MTAEARADASHASPAIRSRSWSTANAAPAGERNVTASVDVRATVRASGGSGSRAGCEVVGEAGVGSTGPRLLCPFCDFTADDVRPHIALMHKARIEAFNAYQRALEAGAAITEARARYNAVLYAAVEGGPGRYHREERAHG